MVYCEFPSIHRPITANSGEAAIRCTTVLALLQHDKPVSAFVGLLSNFSINVNYCYVLVLAKCHEYVLSKITGIPPADAV